MSSRRLMLSRTVPRPRRPLSSTGNPITSTVWLSRQKSRASIRPGGPTSHHLVRPRARCWKNAQIATASASLNMNRETIKQYLDQTEKHIDASDKLVQDQKALIALLEERGRDTARSKTTLAHLEEMRRLHVADRDRLLQALREFEE